MSLRPLVVLLWGLALLTFFLVMLAILFSVRL